MPQNGWNINSNPMFPESNNPLLSAMIRPQLVNGLLRGTTLLSRLALLSALARLLAPHEVGLYGLFAVSITFSMLAVGLDFYTYSQREILARPRTDRAGIILHHAGLSGLAYLVVIPISMVAFFTERLPWWILPWFFILLILEHAAQEINRLLIAMQRQLTAGTVLFIRQGIWIWPALAVMWKMPETRALPFVFFWWLGGCVTAIALGAWQLRREIEWPKSVRWDWKWIGCGIHTSLMFLVGSICIRGILTFDRYLFESFVGLEILGVYTLYAGVAMALMNFLDAVVYTFRFPPMVQAYHQGDYLRYHKEWRRLVFHTSITLVGVTSLTAALGFAIGLLANKPIYLEHLAIFWWLLAAISLQALGMIPHYGLYAMRRDRPILVAHGSGLAVFLVIAISLSIGHPHLGVPVAVAVAFGWILLAKLLAYRWACNHGSLRTPSLPSQNL